MSEVDVVGGFATFVAALRAGGFRARDVRSGATSADDNGVAVEPAVLLALRS